MIFRHSSDILWMLVLLLVMLVLLVLQKNQINLVPGSNFAQSNPCTEIDAAMFRLECVCSADALNIWIHMNGMDKKNTKCQPGSGVKGISILMHRVLSTEHQP